MTARHKFRPSLNLDEFDLLQGSSESSNATGTTFSALWERIFDKTIAPNVDMLG